MDLCTTTYTNPAGSSYDSECRHFVFLGLLSIELEDLVSYWFHKLMCFITSLYDFISVYVVLSSAESSGFLI